jgi:hypothetical protein
MTGKPRRVRCVDAVGRQPEGRVAAFKPAGAQKLKELERVKGIEPSS